MLRGLIIGLLLLAGSQYLLVPVRSHGISMLPTYGEGQLLLVNRLAYRFASPKRGDVVAITLPGGQAVLVKRVIGLPGERIRIVNGQVFVNDVPLPEPYVRYRRPWAIRQTQLGADELFVVGDNRSMPEHLHDFGRVPLSRVLGRLLY